MIAIIRITGLVEVPKAVNETLFRMRLRKKYTTVLMEPTPENMKLIESVRNLIAFGPITPETLKLLVEKRGQALGGKSKTFDVAKVIDGLGKKSLDELGVKPFFRLHPPRGGIKSKLHFPKGVLGDNKEKINDLIRRML